MQHILALLLLVCTLALSTASKNLCFAGSSLYQQITQDCTSQDRNYNGTWYCAKVEICEAYMSNQRECIVTRGCAKEAQCVDSTTGKTYDNYKVTDGTNGQKYAGMTIATTCCKADNFPSDDTVAVDYSQICNSASQNQILPFSALILIGVLVVYLA